VLEIWLEHALVQELVIWWEQVLGILLEQELVLMWVVELVQALVLS
jgi:hypothetical protein